MSNVYNDYANVYMDLQAARNPDEALTLKRRCYDRCIKGLNAEEAQPGCTPKPAAWWQAELERWQDSLYWSE